ncbi:MAG: hypothetical protein AB1775_03240 [Bacteroidota bacterium]
MKHISKYFFLLFFISISSCNSQAQQPKIIKHYPIDSLNNSVFESLKSKKIVMLGDAIHGHGYFKRMVINILNGWIDKIENNPDTKTIPHKLFLCLEKDSIAQLLVNKVINNGELNNYLSAQIDEASKFGGWEKYSIDNIEFLFNLREIKQRIEELNKKLRNDQLDLRIVGIENLPPFDFSKALQMGGEKYQKELFLWFANERDKKISENMKRFMNANQDYKAILFYGTAHLIRKYVDKSPWAFSTKQEPIFGYFLANYLDGYFGREQVEVYYTDKVHGTIGINTDIIQEFEKSSEYYDYHLLCDVIPDFPFPIYLVNNKQCLESSIELMDKYVKEVKNEDRILFIQQSRFFYDHVKRSYLYFEKSYKDKIDSLASYPLESKSHDIKFIYNTTRRISVELKEKFDVVKNIDNMNRWIEMTETFDDAPLYLKMLKTIIYNLPRDTTVEVFYSNLGKSYNYSPLNELEIEQIKKRIDEIKIYYAVNMMWINTKEENKNTIKYLQRFTCLNFTKAKEWNDWWREKYFANN